MGAKQIHDIYGKKVLREAFKEDFNDHPDSISFGSQAGSFKIDGTIEGNIAVEIESRVNKQVRGAIVDIICHPFPKKLIIIIAKHSNQNIENQCKEILKRIAPNVCSKVVTLKGDGNNENIKEDSVIIKSTVDELKKAQPVAQRDAEDGAR